MDEIGWYDYNYEFGYEYGYDYYDYYDDYDNDSISYYEDEYALGIEEEYEYKCSPKGKRGSSATAIREKLTNKAKRRPVRLNVYIPIYDFLVGFKINCFPHTLSQ